MSGSLRLELRLVMSLAAAVAIGTSVHPAAGAALPDWARATIASDNPHWVRAEGGIVLLDSTKVRFIPGGVARTGAAPTENKVQVLCRGVVMLTGDAERNVEYATFPYNPGFARIVSASSWVVSPDGRKVDSFGRGDFVDSVAVYNNYAWDFRRLFRFPSEGKVGPGGILAWEFSYEADDVFHEIGKQFLPGLPVLKAEFEVIPSLGSRLEYKAENPRLGNPSAGSEPGALKWTVLRELPLSKPIPTGFFANPLSVMVRCSPSSQGPSEYTWSDVSKRISGIIESCMEPVALDVSEKAKSLVEGKTARWERVRALSEFVQGTIVYLEITLDQDVLAGMRPHPPSEVLRHRYGDCKDKATLLVSMLRSVGEDARVALVSSGNPTAVAEAWPTPSFDHMIVLIRADGSEPAAWPVVDGAEGVRWVLFDPTNTFTPLGVLAREDAGGFCLIVSSQNGRLFRAPFSDPASSRALRKVNAVVDARGGLRAEISEDSFGVVGAMEYGTRFNCSHEQYQQVINARVHRTSPLCRDLNWTDDWSPSDAHYHLFVSFSAGSYGRAMPAGLMLVSPDVLPGTAKFEPWTTENDGIVVLGPDEVEEEVRLTIPEGYTVEELPEGWKKQQASLSAEVTYRIEGVTVVLTKRLSRKAGFFQKSEYEAIRNFYREIHEAERRSVLLRRPVEKG
jgi:transglutaminase-like putative cysteine protease